MSDSKRIVNLFVGFLSGVRNNFGCEPSSWPEPLRSLRIRYWYGSLRERAGLNNAYQMEKHFEPDSFARNSDGSIRYYKNKWIGYEQGLHLPQSRSRLLRKVEEKCPGSTWELNHPLWSVLNPKNTQVMQGDAFLRQLVPAVQDVLFVPGKVGAGYLLRAPITNSLLNKLERRACLDVLACLAWLLRESAEKKNKDVERIRDSLHNVLVMMALELHALNVALPMLQLFIDSILPLGDQPYCKIQMTPIDYINSSGFLNIIAYTVPKNHRRAMDWTERVRIMRKLLKGDYGLDVLFAMRPVFDIGEIAVGVPDDVLKRHLAAKELREMSWECMQLERFGWRQSSGLNFAEGCQSIFDVVDFRPDESNK